MHLIAVTVLSVAALALASAAQAGERARAQVDCSASEAHLHYSCTITLEGKKSGEPLEADELVVKADMPSMPMAHNVPPAQALPVPGEPGTYVADLELEMFGEWALSIEIDGVVAGTQERVRDKVVVKHEFGDANAMNMQGHDADQDAESDREGAQPSHQGHGHGD